MPSVRSVALPLRPASTSRRQAGIRSARRRKYSSRKEVKLLRSEEQIRPHLVRRFSCVCRLKEPQMLTGVLVLKNIRFLLLKCFVSLSGAGPLSSKELGIVLYSYPN